MHEESFTSFGAKVSPYRISEAQTRCDLFDRHFRNAMGNILDIKSHFWDCSER